MRLRKFLIVVFELFIILSIYKLWESTTTLSIGSYLLFALIAMFLLNYWLAKWDLMSDISNTFLFKIFSRMAFTRDWFGIFTMFFLVLGFIVSRTVFQSAFMVYLIIIIGVYFAYRFFSSHESQTRENGLFLVAFLLGIGIGSKYASNWFIILIFIIGNIFLYLSSVPREKEEGLY